MRYDAIVIGAGPNGLAAAARLGAKKRRVLVVDAAPDIGGQARTIEFAPGFRAPLCDDPGWLPPAVANALGVAAPTQARPITTSVALDDELFALPTDPAAAADRIARYSSRDAARWPGFIERLGAFAGILGRLYQLVPPDLDALSLRESLPLLGVARAVRGLGRDDMTEFLRVMPMAVQDLLDDTFESEPLKAALAAAAVRDLRQGPRSGGTTFNLLHYMVGAPRGAVRGRPWWPGRPDEFVHAAAGAARAAGADIRTGVRATQIRVHDYAVTGIVMANGDEHEAPLVLSTADPAQTLLRLVDPVWLDPEFTHAVRNVKLRGCTAFVFFAFEHAHDDPAGPLASVVSCTPTTTALERAADAAKYGEPSREPHVEFWVPTLRWPGLAPEGRRIAVARVQYAPYALREGSWGDQRCAALAERATEAIGRVIPGFADLIEHRAVLTPRDLEERFGVTEGALTHGELTLDQILFMRPVPGRGRYAMPVDGLFLGGAGAHPGPGVLGGAGWLAAEQALRA